MSQRTLPLLIINLGGEMIYILDQRLRAQDENDDKTQRGNKPTNPIAHDSCLTNESCFSKLVHQNELYLPCTSSRVGLFVFYECIMRTKTKVQTIKMCDSWWKTGGNR